MIGQQKAKPILVRRPRELKVWIEREAKRNSASQNSEIIRSIRVRMEVVKAKGPANER